MESKRYTKKERTEMLQKLAEDTLRQDPNIDRFHLAELLIAAAAKFLPLVEGEE